MPNRLAQEASPYLRQHAENPVDWYPWGPEALARAAAEDRPILLSVGYSACHWCHVMEHESFSDPVVAAQMNADFVNIKVDREERPDLDELYMQAVMLFSRGHGGWPMTLFLTPDGQPYFAGTYFPPTSGRGMPSFTQVLRHAATLWRDRRADIADMTGEVLDAIRSMTRLPAPADSVGAGWLERIADAASRSFDAKEGGFSGPPKFPPHGMLAALGTHAAATGDSRAAELVDQTLDAMAKGGMYDLAGGGFARYSVDNRWLIPHFEKMLYDAAQLVPLYLSAWRRNGQPQHARVVRETLDQVLREMTHPEGGFYASFDADSPATAGTNHTAGQSGAPRSHGEEGLFYTWTPLELRAALGLMDGLRAATLLGVTDSGNFEHGRSVLRLEVPRERLSPDDQAFLARIFPVLREVRDQRPWPGRDDKVVVSWNGLMIGAMAMAGATLDEPRYLEAAARAATFVAEHHMVCGRLHRTWLDGRLGPLGVLDDHSNLLYGLVELHQATLDPRWLNAARALAEQMLVLFWDEDAGICRGSGQDAERLVVDGHKLSGGAEPAGNAIAAWSLARLSALCADARYATCAERILLRYRPLLDRAPGALGYEAVAAAWLEDPFEVAIVGAAEDPRTQALIHAVRQRAHPFVVLARADRLEQVPWNGLLGATAFSDDTPSAFVCRGRACLPPVRTPDALRQQLTGDIAPDPGRGRMHAPALPTDPSAWILPEGAAVPTLSALRGRVVVLDFWTYCCINCLHVLPELAAIEQEFAGAPVTVIGVHAAKFDAEKVRENVAAAVERLGVHHPVVLDPEHTIWEEYAVRSWPTLIVLDPEGRIAWQQGGEVPRAELSAVISRLLAASGLSQVTAEPAASPTPESTPVITPLPLRFPGKVAVHPDPIAQMQGGDAFGLGNRVYLADTGNHRIVEASLERDLDGWPRARVRRVFGDGTAGLIDGENPRFRSPQGLSRHGDLLWIADTGNHALRRVKLGSGEVETVAGTGELGRGGPEAVQPLRSPWDVVAQEGVAIVAMAGAHQLWIFQEEEEVFGPFVGSGREDHVDGDGPAAALAQPSGLCLAGRLLLIADSEVSSIRYYDLQTAKVGTVVGRGLFDFGDVDGAAPEVRLQHPLGVTLSGGRVYVADTYNGKIKEITLPQGTTRTLSGGLAEPGGIAPAAEFLLVADTNHHRLVAVHRQTGETREVPLLGLLDSKTWTSEPTGAA